MRSKVTWMQPQWACQTIFIMVLVLSQVALCVFVLTQNMDRKASDMEKTTLPTNRFAMNSKQAFPTSYHTTFVICNHNL